MVPYRHVANLPLLPYERQLIAALGCSEEEYKQFVEQVKATAATQPKAAVTMTGFEIFLANLIIGIALSAVSYLLAPKPKLDSPTRSRQKQLGGRTGRENYAPSFGFDSIQDLAAYGNVVPIAFTKREDHVAGYSTGGLTISPSLVWSRLKSWGGFQVLEMVAIAGQGKMAKPDLAGIFFGNNALDSAFADNFQFYWNGGYEVTGTNSRLRGANLRYGSLFVPAVPGYGEDAFVCPTRNGVADLGFCGAFTPSNQTRFGVYGGIPNGTPYRPNWEIVQLLKDAPEETWDQQETNQKKFVEPYLRETHEYGGGDRSGTRLKSGMPGTGRNYARHVGIVALQDGATGSVYAIPDPVTTKQNIPNSKANYTAWVGAYKEERYVKKGDIITVHVGHGRQETKPFDEVGKDSEPVRLDDVRSATDSEAVQFDQAMSVGDMFMIGRSAWQVIERLPPGRVLDNASNQNPLYVKLKCVEAWSAAQNKIGLVAEKAVKETRVLPYGVDIDETWYPLLRVEFGSIRNTRPCDVTEIGIKSQVWTRFNGITNFNSVPSPRELFKYNKKSIQVREGKNTSYAHRVSFFALDARPANSEPFYDLNKNEGFVNLAVFAVIGSTPQDIFSFIRIKHPSESMYEFRLRPFNSAVMSQQSDGNFDVFELNGARTPFAEWTVDTYMGLFTVGGRGRYIRPQDYFTHYQMVAKPELLGNLVYGEWLPGTYSVQFVAAYSNVDNRAADWRKISNIMSLASGRDPYFNNVAPGTVYTFTGWNYERDMPTRGVYMKVTLKAFERTVSGTPRNRWWEIISIELVNLVGTWNNNDTFLKNATDGFGEQWRFEHRIIQSAGTYVEYNQPKSETRVWETYSGIAEVSHYGDLITRSCDSGPEHEVVYVNESVAEDRVVEYDNCAVVGLKLQSSNNFTALDQIRCYVANGIEVERLVDGGTGASNLFTDLLWYLATDTDTGAGAVINRSLLDRDQLIATGRYLRANRLFFDDVVAEPVNLRSWLAEKAPSMLCFVAIKNGLLSVNPALPINDNYEIANIPVPISAMFTDGNIIDGSLSIEWLELEERQMFQAAVIYRRNPYNKLPQQETIVVRYNEAGASALPLEEFDLPHITSLEHATKAAQYFLAIRKHVTHTLSFQTLPYGVSLAPGDFIRVAVQQSPYSPANNGIITADGAVVSVSPMVDGSYEVYYWDRSQPEIDEGTLTISNGVAQDLRNTVFSVKNNQVSSQVYQVEAIDLNEDGIVGIKASSFPVDSQGRSLIAADVLSSSNFEIIGQGAD